MSNGFLERAHKSMLRYGGHFFEAEITGAQGTRVFTRDGRSILDFTSGQMSATLGHGHPEIFEALTKQAESVVHLYSGMLSQPVVGLAEDLCAMTPEGLDRVMFLSTGGEANDAAIRLAKLYTGGFEIVSFQQSWHGVTGAAGSATYAAGRKGYGPVMPGNFAIPAPNAYRPRFGASGPDWETQLRDSFAQIDAMSTGNLAAFIAEPILSTGGMLELPAGYLRLLKTLCEERGMLLILDEAQTGLGRTGLMFAFERDKVTPDILTLSKSLGAGMPLSAVMTGEAIEQLAHDRGFLFYTTHASDPLPAAVGRKVIEVVRRDRLDARADQLGAYMKDKFRQLAHKHDVIGDVRGAGLLMGVELVSDAVEKRPANALGNAVASACEANGLSINIASLPGLASVFRIAPPLTVSTDEIDEALDIFGRCLEDCLAQEAV
ncbi:aspartate aminotransferase family protein [Arenibacterium halophilum]|uniref:Aspartate aminotransferase family protein n=1 Tax=Arenibacterium halophilum TaxID=2583821 RepID=A0ABY2X0B9_9RHOB|nr:aspartate aminotransferase family protein [Arenibacterium halophilum]TMV08359.1 aspartate aminotransferase family protein [Arenibacterium halophilum]